MLEKLGILGVLALLILSSGCTMCCHPYDQCGPVYEDSCGAFCSNTRAGSILDGGVAQTKASPFVPEGTIEEGPQQGSPTMAPQSVEPQPVPESEPQILSAVDRHAGQTATPVQKTYAGHKKTVAKKPSSQRVVRQAGEYTDSRTSRW
jgi:hypothetical protein